MDGKKAGQEITITKHGAPVAKLVPVKKEASPEERVAVSKRIQKLTCGLSLGGFKVEDVRGDNSHNCKDQVRASN